MFFISNQSTIKPNTNHIFNVNYPRQIGTIFDLSFKWTLLPFYNLKFLINKPKIYLNHISLVPDYLLEDDLGSEIDKRRKVFCTSPLDKAIKHKEIVQLFSCTTNRF